nr:MAG TPA: hypothetical protein [Crassvirales sp.]
MVYTIHLYYNNHLYLHTYYVLMRTMVNMMCHMQIQEDTI